MSGDKSNLPNGVLFVPTDDSKNDDNKAGSAEGKAEREMPEHIKKRLLSSKSRQAKTREDLEREQQEAEARREQMRLAAEKRRVELQEKTERILKGHEFIVKQQLLKRGVDIPGTTVAPAVVVDKTFEDVNKNINILNADLNKYIKLSLKEAETFKSCLPETSLDNTNLTRVLFIPMDDSKTDDNNNKAGVAEIKANREMPEHLKKRLSLAKSRQAKTREDIERKHQEAEARREQLRLAAEKRRVVQPQLLKRGIDVPDNTMALTVAVDKTSKDVNKNINILNADPSKHIKLSFKEVEAFLS